MIKESFSGDLDKMNVEIGDPIQYQMKIGDRELDANALINHEIELIWNHEIHCKHCGRLTETSYFQGYCYPCFKTLPQTDDCIFNPELCQAHEGISRDMKWSENFCLQDHYVYLALVDAVKVGVTRANQIPTRWIDQGAWKAILLAKTPNRYTAGLIEVELKKHLADKTNWRNMLKNIKDESVDLIAKSREVAGLLPSKFQEFLLPEEEITELIYPVEEYPQKLKYFNFEKTEDLKDILIGIRGQYLIFKSGIVLNIRKYGGYNVTVNIFE